MTVNPRSYAGAAPFTTLLAGIDGSTTTITLTDASGWVEVGTTGTPLGTSGGFVVALDFGLSTEEKIYCPKNSLVGSSISGVTRGYEGGSTSHATGTTATHPVAVVFSAHEAKEANVAAISTSQISGNSGTGASVSAIGATATVGTSKYTAAFDHAHDFAGISSLSDSAWDADIGGINGSSGIGDYNLVIAQPPTGSLTGYTTYIAFYSITTKDVDLSADCTFNIEPGHQINGTPTYEGNSRRIIQKNDGSTNSTTVFHTFTAARTDAVVVKLQMSKSLSATVGAGTVSGHCIVIGLI